MKETFYFSHDYNTRADAKIKQLIRRWGLLGYGVYWAIIEDLYQNANALQTDCEGIAFDLRTDSDCIASVLYDFDLFIIKNGVFSSASVGRRLSERAEKTDNAKRSAAFRWNKTQAAGDHENYANAMRTHSDGNAIKESKLNKSKLNISIENGFSKPNAVTAIQEQIARNEKRKEQLQQQRPGQDTTPGA